MTADFVLSSGEIVHRHSNGRRAWSVFLRKDNGTGFDFNSHSANSSIAKAERLLRYRARYGSLQAAEESVTRLITGKADSTNGAQIFAVFSPNRPWANRAELMVRRNGKTTLAIDSHERLEPSLKLTRTGPSCTVEFGTPHK